MTNSTRQNRLILQKVLLPSHAKLNNTLRDSLSRQNYLQHCASYTELADPNTGHQVVIDKRIVELMEEQQVNIDSYYDPQINLITLSFDHYDLEQRFRNHGKDRDGSGNLQNELGYQLAMRSYLINTLSLFVIFLIIMAATLINLTGGDAFIEGQLWLPWLLILVVGLVVEGSIVVLPIVLIFSTDEYCGWSRRLSNSRTILLSSRKACSSSSLRRLVEKSLKFTIDAKITPTQS